MSDDAVERLAERQARGELDAADLAELEALCRDPDFAREFVEALGDRHEWREWAGRNVPADRFARAVLERRSGRADTEFVRSVTARASRRSARRLYRSPSNPYLIPALVAAAFLVVLLAGAVLVSPRPRPAAPVAAPAEIVREPEPPAPVPAPTPAAAPAPRPVPPPPAPPDRPAPPPPPPPLPPPAPAPDVKPPPPAPRETVVAAAPAVAVLERATGAVSILRGELPAAAEAGTGVNAGEGLQTGQGALAVLRYPDGTAVEAGGETMLRRIGDRPPAGRRAVGKNLHLAKGTVAAQVGRQPAGEPMLFTTPHAEVVVLGTRLTLAVTADATRLDVQEGRVRITRLPDRASVEVKTGQFAVARAGAELVAARPLRFVKGVNLNGKAVTIDGRRWLSHEEALADGLAFPSPPELTVTSVAPRPAADPDTTAMLNSAVFRQGGTLAMSQAVPNGVYDVHLWVMENLEADYRSFDVRVEGTVFARNVGAGQKPGEWTRFGPLRVAVGDGTLNVDLVRKKSDPHLMGFAIFEAGP